MDKKISKILNLVEEYIEEKHSKKTWKAGEDWIQYSGPILDSNEYTAVIESLLGEWLIFGKTGREFETQFPKYVG